MSPTAPALLLTILAALAASFVHAAPAAKTPASGAGKGPQTPVVRVASVGRRTVTRSLPLTGEVVAVRRVTLAALVDGPVVRCPFREGDRVEVGDVVVEVDRGVLRAEVVLAEATRRVADAKLADMRAGSRPEEVSQAAEDVRRLEGAAAFAAADLQRIATLVKSGSLPGEALEKARVDMVDQETRLAGARQRLAMLEAGFTGTAVAVQEASVREAEARVELARARLDETIARAPFAAVVAAAPVREGATVSQRQELATLYDPSSVVVRTAVPEGFIDLVTVGTSVVVSLDALPGRPLPGRVARLFPDLDPAMRTRTVEVEVDDPSPLLPGMFARLLVHAERRPDVVAVPREALHRPDGAAPTVFVLDDGGAARRRTVTVGLDGGAWVEVTGGLAVDEKVVVAGAERLRDGAAVTVAPAGQGGGR